MDIIHRHYLHSAGKSVGDGFDLLTAFGWKKPPPYLLTNVLTQHAHRGRVVTLGHVLIGSTER